MNPKEKELLLCLALLAPTSASMMPAWASHPLPTASPIETVQTRERVAAGMTNKASLLLGPRCRLLARAQVPLPTSMDGLDWCCLLAKHKLE